MSLQSLGKDLQILLFTLSIDCGKDYKAVRQVSKDWKAIFDRSLEEILKGLNKPADCKNGDSEYFYKLYHYIFKDGIYFGRRGVHNVLFYKDLFRFGRDLEKGEGHTPKTHYFLYTHSRKGYEEMDGEEPIYVSEDPKVAITPLNYFRQMENLCGAGGVAGPKAEYQSIYYAMFDNRQKANPNDDQLKNSCFGEFAFYDCEGCTSSSAEKAAVIFKTIQDKFHEFLYSVGEFKKVTDRL